MIHIKRIETDDPLYQKERLLRNKILLRPIGIPDFGWEKHDYKSWHFVAMEDKELMGCVVLVPLDNTNHKAQLIQMAVDIPYQGKGLGRQLVDALINFARSGGFKEVQIHSRSDITSFYSHLGFTIYGDEFEEVGVKHQHMKMKLF